MYDVIVADARSPRDGRLIETPMGRIFVMERGPDDGRLLILAHGTAAWSGFWSKEVDLLAAAGYRAIAYDLPPFGYSDRAAPFRYWRNV